MAHDFQRDFTDLNLYRGKGEDPSHQPPQMKDRPRGWPLDRWSDAPRDLGYSDFSRYHWKGMRLLKDPETLSTLHDLLWEIRPRTIIELGVFSGASLVWFRDMTRLMGIDCKVIGVDIDLSRCRIPASEMDSIIVREADCNSLASLEFLRDYVSQPMLIIDDAHCNTFNVMRWAVENMLKDGDYFIIEDMIPLWERYSPNKLAEYLGSFRSVLEMDMVYANACAQMQRGVFRRTAIG